MAEEKREIAVKFTGVGKKYTLGEIQGRTMREELRGFFAARHPSAGGFAREQPKEFYALRNIDLSVY